MGNEAIENILVKLSLSNFRSRFYLKDRDIIYINNKGLDVIRQHAYDFINKRLAPAHPFNDGSQTPMRGHPVFIAQHATATCCRNCLSKWHHIPKGVPLTQLQIEYIVNLIMTWIDIEYVNSD